MKRYEMKEFNKLVNALKSNEAKKDQLIDDLVRNALYHSVINNQKTPAVNLVSALGRSTRKTDLINYMTKYGNLVWGSEHGSNTKGLLTKLKTDPAIKACWKDEDASWAYVESLPSFWDDQKEKEPDYDFDVKEYLIRVRKTITSKIKAASEHNGKVSGQETIEGFNKFLESIGAPV